MKRLGILVLSMALASCAGSSADRETAPRDSGDGGGFVDPVSTRASTDPVEISVDTGDRELGAYTIVLVYDNSLVRVTSVEPSAEFPAPQFLRRDLTSGKLVLSGFRMEHPYPKGRVSVARVMFESLGGPSSQLTVRILNLYDSEARPVKGRADASRERVP